MKYILTKQLDEDDVYLLNVIGCQTVLVYPKGQEWVLSSREGDSGWCDYSTGAYLVQHKDRAVFINPSERDLTFLTLKYGEDFKPLNTTTYFKELSNVID